MLVLFIYAEFPGNFSYLMYNHDSATPGPSPPPPPPIPPSPPLFSVAGTPTGVTATRTGYTTVNVSWTAPSTGTPPASYEVFYQLTGVAMGSIVSGGITNNTELPLTGLTLGNYSIYVVGYGAEEEEALPSFNSETRTIMIGSVVYIYLTKVSDSSGL